MKIGNPNLKICALCHGRGWVREKIIKDDQGYDRARWVPSLPPPPAQKKNGTISYKTDIYSCRECDARGTVAADHVYDNSDGQVICD